MPDTGLPWSLPYPALPDEADMPKYLGQLAVADDLALDTLQASVPVIPPNSVLPFAMACGVVSVAAPVQNSGSAVVITFPVGRFTVAPVVTVGPQSNGYSAGSIASTNPTQTTMKYYNPTATTPTLPTVQWMAVQMTDTSGPG